MIAAEVKQKKEDVDYGPAKANAFERCGNCRHFDRPRGLCRRVAGRIEARMWCKLWSRFVVGRY